MAPHVQRDYHSTGVAGRYSLRTLKHGEYNSLRPFNDYVSEINEKEDFFRCIGLQMKRLQYEYKMPNDSYMIKKINIPSGVKLRDCGVVILGTTCELCGTFFKCKTELDEHNVLLHRIDEEICDAAVKQMKWTESEIQAWKKIAKPSPGRASATKLSKKLHLILRIGKEIVAEIWMKRKHLKGTRVDTCTQTEPYNKTGLIIGKDGHEGITPRIDPSVFCNSPCQCCNSSVCVVNSQNQYLVSNIVASKEVLRDESTAQEENCAPSRLEEIDTTSVGKNCGAADRVSSAAVPLESNSTVTNTKCSLLQRNGTENGNPNRLSSVDTNDTLILDKLCCNSRLTETSEPLLARNRDDSVKSSTKSTDSSCRRTVQSCQESDKEDTVQKDINGNRIEPRDFNTNEKEMWSPEKRSNSVQVILPVIVPDKTGCGSPPRVTVQSLPVQQQGHQEKLRQDEPSQQSPRREQQEQLEQQQQQQTTETCTLDAEYNSDNEVQEVQEVLRIVRRSSSSSEINHESPTRFEQEMLVQDAIKDMKRMELRGWHLLETVERTNKKGRAVKSHARNSSTNDEPAKKRRKIMAEPNSECNIVRRTNEERFFSNAKEHAAKVQCYSDTRTVCPSDNVKENLMMTCNRNVNIPMEVLRRYGISYYNEPFEINNNKNTVQESVSRFLVPCTGGMENRSNRPTVIDLANDTDE